MANNLHGDLTLNFTPNDTTVFFIVASRPEVFGESNPVFQLFSNEIRITDVTAAGIEDGPVSDLKRKISRSNMLGQPDYKNEAGFQIIRYSDGTSKKIYPELRH